MTSAANVVKFTVGHSLWRAAIGLGGPFDGLMLLMAKDPGTGALNQYQHYASRGYTNTE